MKKWIIWTVVATILFALVIHVATILLTPYVIMDKVMATFPTNKLQSAPPPKAVPGQVIPLPSPDIAYSYSTWDISKNHIRLNLVIPDSYWSISFSRDNTDNIYTLDDKQAKSKNVEILLVKENAKVDNPDNAIVVKSPSDKGLILIRMIVPSQDKLPDLIKVASQATLTEVTPGGVPLEKPAATSAATTMTQYKNDEYGFSISYPADWQTFNQPGSIFYAKGTAPIPALSVAQVEAGTFADVVTAQLSKSGTGIKVGEQKEVILKDGSKATAAKVDWTVRGYAGESYVVGVKQGNKWFVISVTTIGTFLPYDEGRFSEIANTFALKK